MNMSNASANNPVPTLSALMDTANAQWRVFDLGRRIQTISKKEFALIEDNKKSFELINKGESIRFKINFDK